MTIPVSFVILTHNEELNLANCLQSLVGFEDVHVLDSGSTDGTIAIAVDAGAKVHYNPFVGFGTQRNWAIDHIPTRYDWQFHLDADERMTPELTLELAEILAGNSAASGYHVPSKLIFAGRWLKWAGQYPAYQVRFFNKLQLRFENYGHGQREQTDTPLGKLCEPLIHYGFSKGIDAWFIKHVKYARQEAEQSFQYGVKGGRLFSWDGTSRRRALKRLTSRLPGRYLLRLGYMLIFKCAILDGWAGITYAQMVATYESISETYTRLLSHGINLDTLYPSEEANDS